MPLIPEGLKTYSPRDVTVLISGVPIGGFADGTFVAIEFPESFTVQKGAQGAHTRSRVADASATMTLTLQQTSSSNAILAALLVADVSLSAPFSVLVRDNLGLDLVAAPQCYITQRPSLEFGADAGNREWGITMHNVAGGALGQV